MPDAASMTHPSVYFPVNFISKSNISNMRNK